MKKFFAPAARILILLLLVSALAYLNYTPDTFLAGWDNLLPEFNPHLNLARSLSAVWQEYQGLGLLTGMAHAAALPYQLFTLLLSFLSVPLLLVRYITTFFSLAMGAIGTYFFAKNIILRKFDPGASLAGSLLAALFYTLNLASIQTFFVPLETFSAYFALLPWTLYLFSSYLASPSRANLLWFTLALLAGTTAFHTQTNFVVFSFLALLLSLNHLLSFGIKTGFPKILRLFLVIVTINAFWLLPSAYFTINNGLSVSQSKINQMATPDDHLFNLRFGKISDILLLKGFWLNTVDKDTNGQFNFLMAPWRNHLANIPIQALGFVFSALVIVGLVYSFVKKLPIRFFLAATFGISLVMLIHENPPTGFIFKFFEAHVPFFREIFRFSFTKWSTPISLVFSLYFAIGALFLIDLFSHLSRKLAIPAAAFTLILALLAYSAPAFQGNFISPRMRVKIPDEYFQLFSWFESQDPATRIANFPQYTHWGWGYYDWGYRGSGFLWYGIRQPILDRAFDVWNPNNEQYYREISYALYSKNLPLFEKILDKYQVNWILLDKHVIPAEGENVILYNDVLEQFLTSSPKFSRAASFADQIYVYSVALNPQPNQFLYTATLSANTPRISSHFYRDTTFENLGTYFSANSENYPQTAIFPFQGISEDHPISMDEFSSEFILKTQISNLESQILTLPNPLLTDPFVPAQISVSVSTDSASLRLDVQILTPFIKSGQDQLPKFPPQQITVPLPDKESSLQVSVNNRDSLALNNLSPVPTVLGTVLLNTNKINSLKIYSATPRLQIPLTNFLANSQIKKCFTAETFANESLNFEFTNGSLALLSKNTIGCLSTNFQVPPGSYLAQTNFSYLSRREERAVYALSDSVSGLQYNATFSKSGSPKTTISKFTDLAEIDGTSGNLNFSLVSDAFASKETKKIEYRDIVLFLFPKLADYTFSLPLEPREFIVKSPQNPEIHLPKVSSIFSYLELPTDNHLLGYSKNCNNFFGKKYEKEVTGNPLYFSYTAEDAGLCDYLENRELPHASSYLFSINSKNISGQPLRFCLNNHSSRRCDAFFDLPKNRDWKTDYFLFPSMDSGRGLTLFLQNDSIGRIVSQNQFQNLALSPTFANWISQIKVETGEKLPSSTVGKITSIVKTDTHTYSFNLDSADTTLLVLSQSFDKGWKIKLNQISNHKSQITNPLAHVLVNNWSNGWIVPAGNYSVTLTYAPQNLETAGFWLLLGIIPIFLLVKRPVKT